MLKGLDPIFLEAHSAPEFENLFRGKLVGQFEAWWSFFDEGSDKPIGFCLANVPPHSGSVVILQEMVWYTWAKPRGIRSAVANFMRQIHNRGGIVLEIARPEDEKFFDGLARDGVMRRIGVGREMYANGNAVVYQSWSPTARRSK